MSNKVLVIDNDEKTVAQVSDALGGLGYEVISAANADSGRKMASDISPCLILINLATPGSNGLDLCKTIHTTSGLESVPIVLLTLKEGKFNPVYVKLYGIVAFLKKPFENPELTDLATQHAPVEAGADEETYAAAGDSYGGEEETGSGAYDIGDSDESLSDLQASFEQPIDYPDEGGDEQPSLIIKDDEPTSFDSAPLDGLQDENEISGGFSTDEAGAQWGGGESEDSFGASGETASGEDEGGWGAGHADESTGVQQDADEWGSGATDDGGAASSGDAFSMGSDDSFSSGAAGDDSFSASADDAFSAGGDDEGDSFGGSDDSFSAGEDESFSAGGGDDESFSAGGIDDSFDASGGSDYSFSAAGEGDDFLGDDLAYEEEPKAAAPAAGKKAAADDDDLPSLDDDDFGLEGGDLSDLIQDDKGKKDKKMEKKMEKKGFKKGGGLSKGFIIAFIVVLLLGGGAAAYFFLFDAAPQKKATTPPPPRRAVVEDTAPVPAPPLDEPAPGGAPAPVPAPEAAMPAPGGAPAPAPVPAPAPAAKAAPEAAKPAPAAHGEAQKGKYYVQFGAFSKKSNAERMLKRVIDSGVSAFMIEGKVKGKTLHFVLSGAGEAKKSAAQKEAASIKKNKGFDTAVYRH